jgi:signal transduction histidine kinase
LCRNYLNKASINQDITLEWTRQAVQRGLSPTSFLEQEISSAGLQDQLRRLVGIGNRLTGQRDPETLPQFILDEFVELSGAEQAFIALRDDTSGEWAWSSTPGIPDDAAEDVRASASHVLEQVQTNWQPILWEAEVEVPPAGVPALHQRSVVAVPMLSQGKVWGLLYGAMRQVFGRFTQADLDLLSLLANQAAAALENAQWTRTLEQRVERRTARLASLAEAGRDIAATLDLDTVLRRITENARELLAAETSSVYLLQPDGKTLRLIACAGSVPESVKAFPLQLGQGITGYVAQSGVAEIIADTSRHPRTTWLDDGASASSAGKMVVAPLFSRGQVMGAMTGWRSAEAVVFQPADLDFLVALSRQVVIAIENARLFAATEQARLETEQAWLEAEVAREAAEAARADAERANRAKSAFLANMSHELRTPLNAIMGFTRIVRRKAEGVLPERQVDNLDKVLVSAEHLLGLINTVLDIARIEAGHMDVKLAEFDAAALTKMCLTTAQPLVRRGVALEKEIAAHLPRIVSDQDKIKQIIINLLSNAAKFTHHGRILVTVTQENEHVSFAVSDTGIGIAEEALPRVFEDFQQAEHDTRQKYGGTGLGLPISRSLARMLGGDLTATSVVGEGSTFTLTLPLQFKSAVGEPGAV